MEYDWYGGLEPPLSLKLKSKVVPPENGPFFDMQGPKISADQLPPPPVFMQSGPVQSSDGKKAFYKGPPIPGGETEHEDEGLPFAPKILYQDPDISKGTLKECIQLAENEAKDDRGVERGRIIDEEVYISLKERCGRDGLNPYKIIGKGAFGRVKLLRVWTKDIVIKEVKRNQFKKNEAILPLSSKHPHILKCLGLIFKRTTVEILFEHAGITLCEYMKLNPRMHNATIVRLFGQLISGLKYLHIHGHRHLDLKPSNLCVSTRQDGSILLKIIDFGSAKMSTEVNDFKGMTLAYIAPEISRYLLKKSKTEEISQKADMFSAGLVLMFRCTGKHYRTGQFLIHVSPEIIFEILKFIPEPFRELIHDLLVNLLKDKPSERWTSSQAWFALQEHVESPELQEMTPKGSRKRKAETFCNSTASSVAMDTAHIPSKNEIMGESCPRETMSSALVDLHEGTVQHLPATNIEVYGRVDKVSKTRRPVASFKKPRLDLENGTERSSVKVANTEGWKPTNLVVSLSQSAKVMDDTPAVWDQAGDQHAGQQGDESDLFTGDVSGVNDEEELHQPLTDDAVVDDAATDGSMVDPPDGQPNNLLPCFGELFSSMDISSALILNEGLLSIQ